MSQKPMTYDGCNFLRQRLVLATLSGKAVKIKKIRSKEDNPGLRGNASIIQVLFGPRPALTWPKRSRPAVPLCVTCMKFFTLYIYHTSVKRVYYIVYCFVISPKELLSINLVCFLCL